MLASSTTPACPPPGRSSTSQSPACSIKETSETSEHSDDESSDNTFIVRKLFELLVPHHWPSSSSRIKIALADTAIFKKIIIIINNLDSFLMNNLFD